MCLLSAHSMTRNQAQVPGQRSGDGTYEYYLVSPPVFKGIVIKQ